MQVRDKVFVATILVASIVGGCLVSYHQQDNEDQETSSQTDDGAVSQTAYDPAIVPQDMSIEEKKKRFKALLVPAIDKVYNDLLTQYQEVSEALTHGEQADRITELKKYYNVKTDKQLLMALKPHPRSIVLAQAAIESAWATSRFFIQANNVFGVWSFDSNEPRIAASEPRGEKTIWLKKYASISDSIKDNYEILAKGDAYQEFRALRFTTDDPYQLVTKLERYSEQGEHYGEALASMIRYNQFVEYDQQ